MVLVNNYHTVWQTRKAGKLKRSAQKQEVWRLSASISENKVNRSEKTEKHKKSFNIIFHTPESAGLPEPEWDSCF